MAIICSQPHADRIVVFGMSCVGKTTFAQQLPDHHYYCFDALFRWHDIEGLGLSISANLAHIKDQCIAPRFVLDGWHLADKSGRYFPGGAAVYLVYAPYRQVLSQYRVPVVDGNEHWQMFQRWYGEVDYCCFESVRYFRNVGDFEEMSKPEYATWLEQSLRTGATSETLETSSSSCSP